MQRGDLNIIYNDYYNDLKFNDVLSKSISITNLLFEFISDSDKYIYIDFCDNYYYHLFHNIIGKIFAYFPNIMIITPMESDGSMVLNVINKDTKFIYTNNCFYLTECNVFDGEFFDHVIHFVKFYDKDGEFELVNNVDLSEYSWVKTIGLSLFEPIHSILDVYTHPKLDIYINPDGYVEF